MTRQLQRLVLFIIAFGLQGGQLLWAVSPEIVIPKSPSGVRGEIKFSEAFHDFGTVKRGNKLSYKFAFQNTGPGPLVVFGVHASCGCTAVETGIGKEYVVGEKGTIDVIFDTTNFRGNVTKLVTVMTNEKILPEHTLTLKAMVQEEFSVEPPVIDWSEVSVGQNVERTLLIKNMEPTKMLTVSDLRFDKNILQAQLQQLDKHSWEVKVKLAKDIPPGRIATTLFIINNSTALKELPVPVRGFVQSPYAFSPQYLEFGAIGARTAETRTLHIASQKAENLELVRAELRLNNKAVVSSERFVKVSSRPKAGTQAQELAIELLNVEGMKGSVHGRLFFKPKEQNDEVSIDFYAFFQD